VTPRQRSLRMDRGYWTSSEPVSPASGPCHFRRQVVLQAHVQLADVVGKRGAIRVSRRKSGFSRYWRCPPDDTMSTAAIESFFPPKQMATRNGHQPPSAGLVPIPVLPYRQAAQSATPRPRTIHVTAEDAGGADNADEGDFHAFWPRWEMLRCLAALSTCWSREERRLYIAAVLAVRVCASAPSWRL
jgi:hypothetical protein